MDKQIAILCHDMLSHELPIAGARPISLLDDSLQTHLDLTRKRAHFRGVLSRVPLTKELRAVVKHLLWLNLSGIIPALTIVFRHPYALHIAPHLNLPAASKAGGKVGGKAGGRLQVILGTAPELTVNHRAPLPALQSESSEPSGGSGDGLDGEQGEQGEKRDHKDAEDEARAEALFRRVSTLFDTVCEHQGKQ